MYFYRQSLEKHFQSIHSYLPPNSYPNSASSRSYYQTPTQCTRRYLRPLLQINTLQRKRANLPMELELEEAAEEETEETEEETEEEEAQPKCS